MAYSRSKRISEEIKKVLSNMISLGEIKDPRINTMVSITEVEVTSDLSFAYVYISVFGGNEEETLKGLQNAKGYVRKEIGKRVKLRHSPQVIFKIDKSIENGVEMSKLIRDLKVSESNGEE